MRERTRTRRWYLGALGAAGLAASLGGCSGNGAETDGGEPGTDSGSSPTGSPATEDTEAPATTSSTEDGAQLEVEGVRWETTSGIGEGPVFDLRNTGSSPVKIRFIERTHRPDGADSPVTDNYTASERSFVNYEARQSNPYDYEVTGGGSTSLLVQGQIRHEGSGDSPCDGLEVEQTYEIGTGSGDSLQVVVTMAYTEGTGSAYDENVYTCSGGEVVDFSVED